MATPTPEVQPEVKSEPAPSTTPVVQGCEHYLPMIRQYDWDVATAYAVMQAESTCNTLAVGDTRVIGGIYAPSCGLFQVRTLQGRPPCEELQKPEVNIAYAYGLYKARGFQPWSVYNNGKYQQYMP